MPFIKPITLPDPSEYRRSFTAEHKPYELKTRDKRKIRVKLNQWPDKKDQRMVYKFIERCKELICRIPHPNGFKRHRGCEYRLSLLQWSRGSYIDIREYEGGHHTAAGILLHLDVISKLLPEIIALVRRMEMEDTRDPEQKTDVEVIPA